jgi:DNA-binding NtrC family response regulator
VKLLRVLQEREYRPVGSLVRQKVDLRVISATHRNLPREVARGTFRQDLYYRLNVIAVHIPALRERKEDIDLLTKHFLSHCGQNYSLTYETRQAMLAYDWPGNVRELSNCIQRLTAMNPGPLLHATDLPSPVQNHAGMMRAEQRSMSASALQPSVPAASEAVVSHPLAHPVILPLSEIEKRAILEALAYTKGDHTMAAHLLGIGRTTLYRKLKEYRLDSPPSKSIGSTDFRMPQQSSLGRQ